MSWWGILIINMLYVLDNSTLSEYHFIAFALKILKWLGKIIDKSDKFQLNWYNTEEVKVQSKLWYL